MGRMKCNYCGYEQADIIAGYTRFEKNNVLQCRGCSLVYLQIEKRKEEIESFYTEKYRKADSLPLRSPEELYYLDVTGNDADSRIKFITEHFQVADKRVLEIGSASGRFLQTLKDSGSKDPVGIELGKDFAQYAQARGHRVYEHPIEGLGLSGEFDIIVSFHTLEHMYDPKAVIKAVYAALRPGGCFLGEVPNQNDWRVKIFNDETVKRLHYDPNHYFYFSPVTLKNYLEACGFTYVQLETVERYNSFLQLKNIFRNRECAQDIEEALRKQVFPKSRKDDVRLPDRDNAVECEFNRIFEKGVNAELMGNCLRFIACKTMGRVEGHDD